MGARRLRNVSLTLHYLGEDFIPLPPPLHLSSPCHPPPSFLSKSHHHQCAPGAVLGCVGWRGDEGSEAQRCNRALSSSLCRDVASGWEKGGQWYSTASARRDIFFLCSFTFHDAWLHNLFIYLFLTRQDAINNGEAKQRVKTVKHSPSLQVAAENMTALAV